MSSGLPSTPLSLWDRANIASSVIIQSAAKSVMRQVVLEYLEQIVPTREAKVVVTNEHIASVKRLSRQFADAWSAKLQERGHFQAAMLIQEVVLHCESNLYYTSVSGEDPVVVQRSVPTAAPRNVTVDATETSAGTTPTTCVTSLARIRRLIQRDPLKEEPVDRMAWLKLASQRLDHLGREKLTDWPYSWSLIEKAVQDIPSRLYNTRREAPKLEIIPKSVWEKEQKSGASETTSQETSLPTIHETHKLLSQRRRKKSGPLLPPARKRPRTLALPVSEAPRPASSLPETVDLTLLHCHYDGLDMGQYLHSSDQEASSSIDGCLLGPLLNFGHWHFTRQMMVDSPDTSTWSRRQWRAAHRKARKERLGPHTSRNESEESRTKILRTIDTRGNHWFDLDLGATMLELGVYSDRKLYWFGNVEAILLDEDTDEALQEMGDDEGNDFSEIDDDESGSTGGSRR